MSKYILGIDQSTQGTKAIIFNEQGKIIARDDLSHKQIINELGWVEHDPLEIKENVVKVVKNVVNKAEIDKDSIIGVGISNQRETALIWDKKTGKPLYNAIVWQCSRGKKICERIESLGLQNEIKEKTGLHLSPYFSAAKLAWLIENVEGIKEKVNKNEVCCGNIDSWLIYNLTDEKIFKTDYSNASRTQLFNINTLSWDDDICKIFGLHTFNLPKVCNSNSIYGYTDFNGFLDKKIPINAVMGDSHAALYGQFCHNKGDIKSTYGTGSSIMMNIGEQPIYSKSGLVTSIAWGINNKVEYVLEGNINYTGAVITWLKDNLQLINNPKETAILAENANPKDKSYLVPAFTGLGAPYWNSEVNAIITGMTRVTGKNEIVRAGLDSIAYQIADIVNLMKSESGLQIKFLKVDGGPTKNNYLMQFQSDILNIKVEVSSVEELSACGVAYMAGIALGLYDLKLLNNTIKYQNYVSKLNENEISELYKGWKNAVKQTLYNVKI